VGHLKHQSSSACTGEHTISFLPSNTLSVSIDTYRFPCFCCNGEVLIKTSYPVSDKRLCTRINTTLPPHPFLVHIGVVGLAIARAAARCGLEVILLESQSTFGTITSSRHSEVIHAGIYYPRGSNKASLCVEGKALLYEYCRDRGVPHKRLGKLIVAASEQ